MVNNAKQKILLEGIVHILNEKKAVDVIVLDLEKTNSYFGYFLVASAHSNTQLKALVQELMGKFGSELPRKHVIRSEEYDSGWVILDFIDIVVHLFREEQRSFYNLERLWGDAKKIKLG